jgi:hypothetical protein
MVHISTRDMTQAAVGLPPAVHEPGLAAASSTERKRKAPVLATHATHLPAIRLSERCNDRSNDRPNLQGERLSQCPLLCAET